MEFGVLIVMLLAVFIGEMVIYLKLLRLIQRLDDMNLIRSELQHLAEVPAQHKLLSKKENNAASHKRDAKRSACKRKQ